MERMLSVIISALTIFVSNPAQAQITHIVGIGVASCAQFNEEVANKPATERDYLAWAQGFLSGALMRAPQGVDEDMNLLPPNFPLQKQADFPRTYCSANPEKDYMDAVHALYQILKGRPS